jgi:hypothetical protein
MYLHETRATHMCHSSRPCHIYYYYCTHLPYDLYLTYLPIQANLQSAALVVSFYYNYY